MASVPYLHYFLPSNEFQMIHIRILNENKNQEKKKKKENTWDSFTLLTGGKSITDKTYKTTKSECIKMKHL